MLSRCPGATAGRLAVAPELTDSKPYQSTGETVRELAAGEFTERGLASPATVARVAAVESEHERSNPE
ncbi:hypothetical protein CYV19_01160 [Natronobacterium gregoryi SP2]|uniref:Uncharacterized protein n=1 Tax=Natronobacterium gregoryi (strain ATCC 43098 / DSM 3393 / CCM 3738 / CIP 104747 / IAM 13177 / JCM 8860 / NBRC 102187 / NCIMB 2189 / SP2) TaxID=797304 RepID=A0A2J4JJF7_NATGS|nr:hypothetical protein CYV19_01160 [Natronobacterium gregoryi SP2]